MPGFRDHPLDAPLNAMVKALEDADGQLAEMSKGIGDFDSKELTPAEDELIFHSPALRYLGQVHPQTGLPYTNAQAAQQFLQDVGPEEYVNYVEDFVRRADRRGKEGAVDATSPSSLAMAVGTPGGRDAATSASPDDTGSSAGPAAND